MNGLGGESCGSTCQALVPVGLSAALAAAHNDSYIDADSPRVSVCPTLCENGLGEPLCGCTSALVERVDWSAVCDAFCQPDRYVLGGCPVCGETTSLAVASMRAAARALSTSEGWAAWCGLQCKQGQGGAACNCNRAPFQ